MLHRQHGSATELSTAASFVAEDLVNPITVIRQSGKVIEEAAADTDHGSLFTGILNSLVYFKYILTGYFVYADESKISTFFRNY